MDKALRRIPYGTMSMLYVDKTAHLHRLITDKQSRNFFLARPQRFDWRGAGR